MTYLKTKIWFWDEATQSENQLFFFFNFLRTFCPHLVSFFLCLFFFHYVSAKFHLWPSSGDLSRPRIGMLSLVTVSPVITAFHSCCLSHHVFFFFFFFWPSKPLSGLGRIWNRYLLTMLTWNHRDSTPLSAAPRIKKNYQDEDKKSALNQKKNFLKLDSQNLINLEIYNYNPYFIFSTYCYDWFFLNHSH